MIHHFLQSHEWEEFQRSSGRKVWRVSDVLLTQMPLAVGKSYFYSAGVWSMEYGVWREEFIGKMKDIAKKENVVFFKFEPMLAPRRALPKLASERAEEGSLARPAKPWRSGGEGGVDDAGVVEALKNAGFKKSTKAIQPQKTILLDISKPEEELLAGMHQKTRYNIRLAQKRDLRFMIYRVHPPRPSVAHRSEGGKLDAKEDDLRIEKNIIEDFLRILQKTQERDSFSLHPKEYYKKLLALPFTKLFVVEYQNKIIAANIVLFHEDRAIYLHGASDYEHRNLMAPYLLHAETIRYAKEHGFKEYDLWGIDEVKWPGLTRFKRGFGGNEISYMGSYDYVFQPMWYKLYTLRGLVSAFTKKLKAKN